MTPSQWMQFLLEEIQILLTGRAKQKKLFCLQILRQLLNQNWKLNYAQELCTQMPSSAYTKGNQEVKWVPLGKDGAPRRCQVAHDFAGQEAAHRLSSQKKSPQYTFLDVNSGLSCCSRKVVGQKRLHVQPGTCQEKSPIALAHWKHDLGASKDYSRGCSKQVWAVQ